MNSKFQALFDLRQYADLKPSFEFIAECLLPDIARFYAVPGKSHAVVVDVVTSASSKSNNHILTAVHCGGDDVLWMDDPDYAPESGEIPTYKKMSVAQFEERLAEEMVVHKALLTIKYASFSKVGNETIHFPDGWTTRRR